MRFRLQFAALCLAFASPAWGAYGYYRTVVTAHTQAGSADSSNFPIKVELNSGNAGTTIKTTANGGRITHTGTQTGGNAITMPFDLAFGTNTTCSTLVPWEVESYSATGGTLIAWVKISTLHVASDDTLYACYGDNAITTQQNTGSYAPSAVWDSNHKGVWHLTDGTTLSLKDSTTNANHGTSFNTPTAIAGQVDGGADFANTNAQITIFSPTGLGITGSLSISTWIKGTDTAGDVVDKFFGTAGYFLALTSGVLEFGIYGSTTGGRVSSGSVADGAWHYIAATYNAGTQTINLYIDGSASNGSTFGTIPSAITDSGTNPDFALNHTGLGNYSGSLDEIQISASVRNADWYTAFWNNTKASSTFLTIGSEQTGYTAYTASTTELLLVLDSRASLAAHFGAPTERLSALNLAASLAAHFGSTLDAAGIADTPAALAAHFASLRETLAASERGTGQAAHFGAPTELAGILDAALGNRGTYATAEERTALAESLIRGLGLRTTDILQPSDRAAGSAAHYGVTADLTSPYESASGHGVHYAASADALGTFEGGLGLGNHFSAVAEYSAARDGGSGSAAHFGGATELLAMLEFSFTTRPVLVFVSELLAMGDSAARLLGLHMAASDAMSGRDTSSSVAGLHGSAAESLSPFDAASGSAGYHGTASEILPSTEAIARAAGYHGSVWDALIARDAGSSVAGYHGTAFDTLRPFDAGARLAGLHTAASDALSLFDSGAGLGNHFAGPRESLPLFDLGAGLGNHFGTSTERLASIDSGTRSATIQRAATEILRLLESVSTSTMQSCTVMTWNGITMTWNGVTMVWGSTCAGANYQVTTSDFAGLPRDSAAGLAAHFAALFDGTRSTDAGAGQAAHFAAARESLATSDLWARLAGLHVSSTELLAATNEALGHAGHFVSASELGRIYDIGGVAGPHNYVVVTTEALLARDLASGSAHLYAPILALNHLAVYPAIVWIGTYPVQITILVIQ